MYDDVRKRRIIIATHMHAGDGNVHVNIPVFSNDRAMMKRAEKTAENVMVKAVELGGVVSGEHGIGITKIKFLDRERIDELNAYRREVDPGGLMNPGKLDDPTVIDRVFTPSFNLLELEARILRHGSLEALSSKHFPLHPLRQMQDGLLRLLPRVPTFFSIPATKTWPSVH